MLRSRIIPCLLVHKGGLTKTINFKNHKYVGDPINAVKIFNEKEVDELMVIDIDATAEKKTPNFELIKNLAEECRMPLCYGGGITTKDEASQIISLGVEKIALSSTAVANPEFCNDIGAIIGNQSVVVVIDTKKRKLFGGYDVYTHNGKNKSHWKLDELINKLDQIGIGEIVINSIDNDGLMNGYDFNLAKHVRKMCSMPLTLMGGASDYDDLKKLVTEFRIIGAAAGSLFVFKGKYRAVLINYPDQEERKKIYS
ncbi:AglZ/HisF2 family acetamidino modification protein [Verrucomicrobiales bacterium]|nr:AglZ/HisF2 family acetamidino modification protein [Verrucomicrobiales bacterium]